MFKALGPLPLDTHAPASYDEVEMGCPSSLDHLVNRTSVWTNDEQDVHLKLFDNQMASILSRRVFPPDKRHDGKLIGTNNFVTKLYQ